MAQHGLKIEPRSDTGTTAARRLRAEGKIPAVVYGHGNAPQHLAVESKAFDDLLHHGGRTSLITLSGGGRRSDTALLREVQYDPVSRRALHADFQRVSADEHIETKLQIVATGVARGVREHGAVMDVVLHEIEVAGPANEIPDHLEVDVTELDLHDHATAGDIPLPKGFSLVTPPDTLVISIEASKTAQAIEEAEIAAPEQPQPEVIGEAPAPGATE